METNEIIEKLKNAGLNIANLEDKPETVFESRPCYRNNFGFHHVGAKNFQAVLIKGVYKEFLRILEGSVPFTENEWNETAKTLNTAEATLKSSAQLSFFIRDGLCFIISATLSPTREFLAWEDIRDYRIPRPLTPVEYTLPASKLYDESIMLTGGYFAEYFPRTLSSFTESVFAKIPDIMNPLFVSCNLKTSSPTTVNVYNNLYINMTLYEKMMKAIGLGNTISRLSFSPHLYLKMAKDTKHGVLNKSYFPVSDGEISDVLAELERTASHVTASSLIEDAFFEYPVQLAIIHEYLDIKLQDALTLLLKIFPTLADALQAVFKTRASSLFYSGEMTLPTCLDFSSEIVKVNFSVEKNIEPMDKFIKTLPFISRIKSGGSVKKTIQYIHKLLDIRDRTYIAASNFIIKSKETLLQIGEIAVSKNKAVKKEDIFYFEHDDVKKIYADSFFGDAVQTTNFRKWQLWRYAAQAVPPEIYGTDFEKSAQLSEKMIIKFLELVEYDVLALKRGEISGTVTNDLNKTDFKGFVIAAKSLYPADMPKYHNASGFILENASPFGFATEYAVIKNIPLYTGIRFAPLVLNGVKIKASENKISKV